MGMVGSTGRNALCRKVHGEHRGQKISIALTEQNDQYLSSDAMLHKPIRDCGDPIRELAVAKFTLCRGYRRGVRRMARMR